MTEKLMEYLTNPIKNRLILEVMAQGTTTAKALASTIKSIPQATLYRYLNKMVSDGVLRVVEERHVRNVTEKVYAMAIDFEANVEKMLNENDGEAYLTLFQQFTIGLLNEYATYCAQDHIDIQNDGSGFRVHSFHATLDELKELSTNIRKLIEPYTTYEATPDRKARSVAVIFTPPTAEG